MLAERGQIVIEVLDPFPEEIERESVSCIHHTPRPDGQSGPRDCSPHL